MLLCMYNSNSQNTPNNTTSISIELQETGENKKEFHTLRYFFKMYNPFSINLWDPLKITITLQLTNFNKRSESLKESRILEQFFSKILLTKDVIQTNVAKITN